jgi:hypothetical protein
MDWIKKNYEKFSLLLLSAALLGVSIFLILSAQGFLASFESLKQPVVPNNKMPALDTQSVEAAQASLKQPATWTSQNGTDGKAKSLFVSRPYLVSPDGLTLSAPDVGISPSGIPSEWIIKNHLDPLDPDIANEDPDGDGFTNLDEYKGNTDPNDKNSHPPYVTKLFLAQFIQVPFRLVFKGQPDDDTYQIDTVDVNQPTQILKMGDPIAGTKFKIVKFEKKGFTDENGVDHDVSELTVQNVETNAKVILVLEKVSNSPDSYAKFRYLWNQPADITVKKDATFSIKPETDIQYKLIDINANEATIQNLKTNEEIKIPLLQK